jgi:hypothetical protein
MVDTAPQSPHQASSAAYTADGGRAGPGRGLVVALAAVVVAGGALVVIILAISHHGASPPTTRRPGNRQPGSDTGPSNTPGVPARQQIEAILTSYASDYSAHDLGGLGSLFAPDVTRYGDKSGGCGYTYGKSAVLGAYAAQFGAGAGAYSFVDPSSSAIEINGATASDTLGFRIAVPSGTKYGQVSFDLSRLTDQWRIQGIRATC